MKLLFSAFGLTLALSGCNASSPDLQMCSDPRPEICTQEYNPVCATLEDGSRKTYATGCTACSDPGVKGWSLGECA